MTSARLDIIRRLAVAQDDDDTVVLPNACHGELIKLDDGTLRCFSVLTRQPHSIPPESWALVQTDDMPEIDDHEHVKSGLLVDHVTRGIMADNAFRLTFDANGAVTQMRLLPPGDGPEQAQWESQAARMIE